MPKSFTVDFEIEVLHCSVIDLQFLKESIPVVKTDYFTTEMTARAWKIISQTYVKSRCAPSRLGFLAALVQEEEAHNKVKERDKQKLILEPCTKLADQIFSTNPKAQDVEDRWIEFCRQREFENCLLTNLQKLESGEIVIDDSAESIKKTHQRINQKSQGGSDFFFDIDTFSSRIKDLRKRKITTGFRTLDIRLAGGYSVGSLSTYVASSKGGKSMILVHTGFNAICYPYNVVHFTLEISQPWIELRYGCRISGIPMDEAQDRCDEIAEKSAEFALSHKSRLFVKGYPPKTASVADFRSYLYWLESEKGIRPNLVLVDYGDLVKSSSARTEERFTLADIWTELRALAMEFDCPVITASQSTRGGYDKSIIKMSDIAESIHKVNISDNIISICKTQEEDNENKARLFLAGSREARSGLIIPIKFSWPTCYMQESGEKFDPEVYK